MRDMLFVKKYNKHACIQAGTSHNSQPIPEHLLKSGTTVAVLAVKILLMF